MDSHALRLDGSAEGTLEWATAGRAHPGQSVSGDMHVVKAFHGGALVAVVDALGHGTEAEATARLAVATLEQYAHESPPDLAARCHRILVGSRGAAMSLASISWMDNTMTWLAIGDVEGRVFSSSGGRSPPPRALMTHGGIVGAGTLPGARPTVVPIAAGDVLVLATDGIRGDFAGGVRPSAPLQQIADELLAGFLKGTDDALVLVVRIRPTPEERTL